ncbi:PQQ-binding-like beta-propeller repeat protein, partial [Streptomyces sp. SID5785]|uniref:outer membrane protein assembly factor BamB family protein n=1 Tax=Streptomyces sp. SID5785 TaxID=2690309 RepID=UPI001361B1C8
ARDTTPPDDAGARTPEARPDPRLAARAGVDIVGAADRSGPAAQSPGQRPAGWRPWQGRLSHAPLDCAADTHALVCQLTNGTYEAVSPVDGKQLWTEGTPHAEGLGLDEAAVNVDGRFEVPGATLAPQSRGGRTVIGDADALRLLDSASGKPRWKARTPHGKGMFTTRPVLTDSAVLAVVESGNDSAGPAATLAAFALTDGHLLWQQPLTAQPYAQISRQSRSVLAVRGHTAYANGDGERFVAVDLRDGKVLRRDADEPGNTVETTPARDLPSGMDRRTTRSLLIADHRLYVDHHRLVDQPLGFGAPARTMPVPGAPAERPSSDVDVSGSVVAEQARPPMVLALGGIAHIVYDQGALVSVELPR